MTLSIISRSITDDLGNLLEGASITIRVGHAGGGTLAELFSDAFGETSVTNPVTAADGTISVYVQPGKYRLEGTSAAGSGVVLVDVGATEGKNYATRVAFAADVAAGYVPSVGTVVYAGGLGYMYDGSSTAISDLAGWVPVGKTLSTNMIAPQSTLSSDPKTALTAAISTCASNGWTLQIDPLLDGSPLEYDYLSPTVSGDLHIHFANGSLLKPKLNYENFDCDGSTTVFTVADWLWDGVETVRVGHVANGDANATKLTLVGSTPGAGEFSVTQVGGYARVTVGTTYPLNDSLIVTTESSALRLTSTAGSGAALKITGYPKADISRRGFILADGTSSGFSFVNWDNIEAPCTIRVVGSPTGGPDAASALDKRGDSGVYTQNCDSFSFDAIHGEYLNDLVHYNSGGGTIGGTDQRGRGHVKRVSGKFVSSLLKSVREDQGVHYDLVIGEDVAAGLSHGITNGMEPGKLITVGAMTLRRVGKNAVNIGETNGSIIINSISVEDWGMEWDGVTPRSDAALIFFSDCQGVQINSFHTRQRDWGNPTSRPVIQIAGGNNYGNRIYGYAEGYDVGLSETGITTNDVGDYVSLTLKDVTTPLSLQSGSKMLYDLVLLTETGGTVTSSARRKVSNRSAWGTPPALYWAGDAAPVHEMEEGDFKAIDDELIWIAADVQVNAWTFTPSGKELRLTIPSGYRIKTQSAAVQNLTTTVYAGINSLPGVNPEFTAIASDGEEFISFRYKDESGSSAGAVTDAHHASGTGIRLVVSGFLSVDRI